MGAGLGMGDSYVAIVFLDSPVHRSLFFPDGELSHSWGILSTNLSCLPGSLVSVGSPFATCRALSDMKTVRMTGCSRQWYSWHIG